LRIAAVISAPEIAASWMAKTPTPPDASRLLRPLGQAHLRGHASHRQRSGGLERHGVRQGREEGGVGGQQLGPAAGRREADDAGSGRRAGAARGGFDHRAGEIPARPPARLGGERRLHLAAVQRDRRNPHQRLAGPGRRSWHIGEHDTAALGGDHGADRSVVGDGHGMFLFTAQCALNS
jgi:hypothetical protein